MAKKPVPSKKNIPSKKPRATGRNDKLTDVEAAPKEPGKLQKLFVWVLIPVLFALAMAMIIAEVTGTNVFEKVNSVISSEKKAENEVDQSSSEDYEKQIVDLKAQMKEKEAQVTSLQTKIDTNKTDLSKAEVEKKQLEKEIQKLQESKADTNTDSTTLVKTYEQMTPKAAAAIIETMSNEEALKILRNLKPATLAPILEKMQPTKAAEYTELLAGKKKES